MQADLAAIYKIIARLQIFEVIDSFLLPFPILNSELLDTLPDWAGCLALNRRFGHVFLSM